MNNNSFQLDFLQEVLIGENYSISTIANVGYNYGKEEGSGLTNKEQFITYQDRLKGYQYSAGLSLNYTANYGRTKVQPFVSSAYEQRINDFDLNYIIAGREAYPVSIIYESESSFLIHTLGFRFIDESTELLSIFSLHYAQNLKQNTSVGAAQENKSINIFNTSNIEYVPIFASISIGFIF